MNNALKLVALLLTGSVVFASTPGNGARLSATNPDGWLIEYVPEHQASTSIIIDGRPHVMFSGASSLVKKEGDPQLPVDVVTFGVPPEVASLRIELLDPVYEVTENILVAPQPEYSLDENSEATAAYKKGTTAYALNRDYPSVEYIADAPTMLRDQRIASIRISPYRYNPATKTLRRLARASIKVTALSATGSVILLPQPSGVQSDPFFESTFREMLVNYDQARGWRTRGEVRLMVTPTDSTRDWFETGKPYYKMFIAEDGWYKVTKAQLVAAGANGSLIDIPTLKVFGRGVQIPIVVQPDTSVEFFARRNYGDSTYLDYYTDTSAYWLTWGGAAGLRFLPVAVDSLAPTPSYSSSFASVHFEENNWYYVGTTTPELINTETIPGEGWAWGTANEWFYPNQSKTFPFTLNNVDFGGTQSATIRASFASTTLNYTTPNHIARVWVNDSLAGEVPFAGRARGLLTVPIPHAWLREGSNTLRIQSVQTAATVSQFYLDWFEIDHLRKLKPVGNQASFTIPAQGSPTRLNIVADGFTSAQILIYDPDTRRTITDPTIFGTANGFAARFRDTVTSKRSYVVVATGGAKPVISVKQKIFSDLRFHPQGADYIIISHAAFMTAAQQLATHRQNVNGVRVKLVDVEDIYDQFNYGVMNATKLRTFLKYAYDNWQTPRPSSLLLFGDACWDFHRYLATTVKTNYVPAYGVPAGDNWFVCFNPDSSSLPFMTVGRIPASDPLQATRTVTKLVGYDGYTLGEWNKNFLMITGGTSQSEQAQFNAYAETTINSRILPPPIGGTPFRVYKSSSTVIDGEHRETMKNLFRDGLSFVNFIGHSGGRIWGVDIGPPTELENTNGKLPFVASVSCNIGGFAEPSANVLSEDFTMADNRGAIATWASSSLGFPNYGTDLVNSFLIGLRDSVRMFGALTTNARVRMLRTYGTDYIATAMVNLNPLIGDPLSSYALPLRPDLAVRTEDVTSSNLVPTTLDSSVTIKVRFHNYGLVPPDSVGISVADIYNGQTTYLLNDKKFAPTRHHDSLSVQMTGTDNVGRHTITATLDPASRIVEVNELNNIASIDQYVYANYLSVVKPLRNMVVPIGQQRLIVTSPAGLDSAGFSYLFELDTVDTFNSPALVSSGPITPGPVTGEWLTPSLPPGRVYFWRARTAYGSVLGRWIESSFSTRTSIVPLPLVELREYSKKQFQRDNLTRAAATDSGATILPSVPVNLYVRSVGYRYDQYREYYSSIKINQQAITGYWWELGSSFMVIRLNEFTGSFDFKAFDTGNSNPTVGRAQSDSMVYFINQTPVGNYLAFSIIFDGATNVSESLKVALERLGSTRVRQVVTGQSWAFIGRKGNGVPGMTPLESLTNDTAVVSLQVPNYYSLGSGSLTSNDITIPTSWESFAWQYSGLPTTNGKIAFLGVRPNRSVDTLRIIPKDSANISLGFLNSITSGERYIALRTAALLSSTDALVTPLLREWSVDFTPPADLAVSARTIGGVTEQQTTRTIEVTVYNIGYRASDSATVTLSVYDRTNRSRLLSTVPIPALAVGGTYLASIPISTTNLPRRATLQAAVMPSKKSKDLVADNNLAYYTITTLAPLATTDIQVYANGMQIMDGDFVSSKPTLMLRMQRTDSDDIVGLYVQFFVDNMVQPVLLNKPGRNRVEGSGDIIFSPALSDGEHQLKFRIGRTNSFGEVDSVEHSVVVRVSREARIMQPTNFPNPFRQDTYFTFSLSGERVPDELVIRVFTVAGRKIRELTVPGSSLNLGFNRVYWNGRDNEGDEIANGYYFYQIAMRGEGKTDAIIQKLSKMR